MRDEVLSSLKFLRELGFPKSYVSFSTPTPPGKFKPWHTNWLGEQAMSSAEDSCQGTGIMDKFMCILNTGTNGQDGRGGQKWTNLKGKCHSKFTKQGEGKLVKSLYGAKPLSCSENPPVMLYMKWANLTDELTLKTLTFLEKQIHRNKSRICHQNALACPRSQLKNDI